VIGTALKKTISVPVVRARRFLALVLLALVFLALPCSLFYWLMRPTFDVQQADALVTQLTASQQSLADLVLLDSESLAREERVYLVKRLPALLFTAATADAISWGSCPFAKLAKVSRRVSGAASVQRAGPYFIEYSEYNEIQHGLLFTPKTSVLGLQAGSEKELPLQAVFGTDTQSGTIICGLVVPRKSDYRIALKMPPTSSPNSPTLHSFSLAVAAHSSCPPAARLDDQVKLTKNGIDVAPLRTGGTFRQWALQFDAATDSFLLEVRTKKECGVVIYENN
jgi:hypothetical protein